MTAGRPCRVLEVIDTGLLGGGQLQLAALATHLAGRGAHVDLACRTLGPLPGLLAGAGVAHVSIPFGKPWDPRPLPALRRLVGGGAYDLVHTHGGIAGLWGRLAAAGYCPTVHTLHGIHYLHFENRLSRLTYRALDAALRPLTAATICVCRSDLEAGIAAGVLTPSRAHVVPNAVDPGRVATSLTRAAARHAFGLPADVPIVGCVGRLHHQKGQCHLIDAAALPPLASTRALVAIAGDGPLRRALEERARRHGLDTRVRLLGDAADVAAFYRALDVFVLPSLWEGLPLSLLEAQMASVPVVATAVDGTLEVIFDAKTGLLVPPGDPAALARAVRRLLDEPTLARELADRGRDRVLAEFRVEAMLEGTRRVYSRVLGRALP